MDISPFRMTGTKEHRGPGSGGSRGTQSTVYDRLREYGLEFTGRRMVAITFFFSSRNHSDGEPAWLTRPSPSAVNEEGRDSSHAATPHLVRGPVETFGSGGATTTLHAGTPLTSPVFEACRGQL